MSSTTYPRRFRRLHMNAWRKQILAALIVLTLAALVAWMTRYTVVAQPQGGTMIGYRLDRWTGEVLFMHTDVSYRVRLEKRMTPE